MRDFDLLVPDRGAGVLSRTLRLRLDPTFWVGRKLEQGGIAAYEPETLACFLAVLDQRPAAHVFDVGANIGLFSLLAAASSEWAVTAFEPTPDLASALRDIAGDNGLNIRVAEVALGDETGTAEFFLSNTTDASNSLRPEFRRSGRSTRVNVERLDDYCDRTGDSPTLIKIDTESTEPAVVNGARRTLARLRPWVICEVLPGWTEGELERALQGLGYHWYQITEEVPLVPRRELFGDRTNTYRNWLFAPEKPDERFWSSLRNRRTAIDQLRTLGQRDPGTGGRQRLDRPALGFTDATGQVAAQWTLPPGTKSVHLRPDGHAGIVAIVKHTSKGRTYLSPGKEGFDRPPADIQGWRVAPRTVYDIAVSAEHIDGDAEVRLWVIQYGAADRLTHDSSLLVNGPNQLRITAHPDAVSLRIAFRLSGNGVVRLRDLEFYEVRPEG